MGATGSHLHSGLLKDSDSDSQGSVGWTRRLVGSGAGQSETDGGCSGPTEGMEGCRAMATTQELTAGGGRRERPRAARQTEGARRATEGARAERRVTERRQGQIGTAADTLPGT